MFKRGKRGQKITTKLSRFSKNVSEEVIEHAQENLVDRLSHVRRVRLLILEWSLLVAAIIFLSITQAYWYTSSYAVDTYKNGGTYTEATLGEVNSLNPLFAQTSSEKTISKLLFASLSSPDYSGHSGYDLARSITSDKSGTIWTVKLRDNLKWSDGEPLTNEDVIFTANLIKNPIVNSSYSSNLSGVEVEEKDGAIIFTLGATNVYFAAALDFPILPEHALNDVKPELLLEHPFFTKPISSGPYVYNATQAIGNIGEKSVYLVANDKYYKGRPFIDSFVVHAFTKSEDIVSALNNGIVTASGDLTGEDVEKVKNQNLSERQASLNYGVYAFFNVETVENKELRQAIKQGVNIEAIRSDLNGEQELDYPFTENQVKLGEYPEAVKLNTNAAKKTIKDILDKDKNLKENGLSIATVNSGNLPKVAEKFAEELRSLGLTAEVIVYDPDQEFALNVLSTRAYDIIVYEVGLGPDPDPFPYYHSTEVTENGHNLSNYKNSVVSDLVLSARSTKDLNLRTKKYENFLKHFVADVPAIGIYQTNYHYFYNKNIRVFSPENRLVTATDRFIDINKWGIEKDSKSRTP